MPRLFVFAVVVFTEAISLVGQDGSRWSRQRAFELFDRFATTGATGALVFRDPGQYLSVLRSDGPAWVLAGPSADAPHRTNLLALLALESGAAMRADRGSALSFIEWGCGLLRKGQTSEFERAWMLASNAIFSRTDLENVGIPDPSLDAHLRHALERYPLDSQLRLLTLLASRPETRVLSTRPGGDPKKLTIPSNVLLGRFPSGPDGAKRIEQSLATLAELAKDPSTAAEAHAHIGLLRFHLNDLPQSLAAFKMSAETSRDPFVQSLAWLGIGMTLDAMSQSREATEAYWSAHRALPGARGAATLLAAHLVAEGDLQSAANVVDTAYSTASRIIDPWHHPVAPERSFPEYDATLRRLSNLSEPETGAPGLPSILLPALGDVIGVVPQTDPTRVPEFRASTTAVTVDVSVMARRALVTGLSAADFELLDNGVPQSLTLENGDAVPIDLSLAITFFEKRAVSSSRGATPRGLSSQAMETVAGLSRALRSTDRVRVLQADGEGAEIWPLQPASRPVQLQVVPAGDWSRIAHHGEVTHGSADSVFDTTVAALLRPISPTRRSLVIAISDGIDTTSALSPNLFLSTVSSASTVVYLCRRQTVTEGAAALGVVNPLESFNLLWKPEPEVAAKAANASGGDVFFLPNGLSADALSTLLARFRSSYILRYQARGVSGPGWHEITVRVKKPGSYEILARKGYQGR